MRRVCVGHEVGNVNEDIWNRHMKKKESARKEKENEKKLASNPVNEVTVVCMDVQRVLLAPSMNASALYYKTKLATHNFTFYNLATREVQCYMWYEGEGGLSANEFASCVVDYIKSEAANYKKVVIFSDGCTYQNRNSILSSALSDLANELNIEINQKYLVRGHTQMEVDSVHSTIERLSLIHI